MLTACPQHAIHTTTSLIRKLIFMDRFNNLQDLLKYQLKIIFDAERQLIKALPILAKKATNIELKEIFSNHFTETQMQQERMLGIAQDLNIYLKGKTCSIIEGLIAQTNTFCEINGSFYKKDTGLIACAKSIERYEMASYSNLIKYAQTLGFDLLANNLQQNHAEELNTFEALQNISLYANNTRQRKAI